MKYTISEFAKIGDVKRNIKTPHWFLAGTNPPKDRGKKGRRRGKRFGGSSGK